jgi:hypothetical protein
LAFRKRLNASWTSAAVQGFVEALDEVLVDGLDRVLVDFFAAGALPDFAAAFSVTLTCPGFAARRLAVAALDWAKGLAVGLRWGLRVIFGMIRVY